MIPCSLVRPPPGLQKSFNSAHIRSTSTHRPCFSHPLACSTGRTLRCYASQPQVTEKQGAKAASNGSAPEPHADLPASIAELGLGSIPCPPNSLSSMDSASMSLSMDSGSAPRPSFIEAQICRLFYFSQDQRKVFEHLIESMRASRTALSALAIATIALTIFQAEVGEGASENPAALFDSGLTLGDVASWVDTLLIAALISYATSPFERVTQSRSRQMAFTFQGVSRLSLVFQQLAIGSVAVSTVTALEAAAKYPPLVVYTASVFFVVALLRSAAMWWVISQHTTNNEEVTRTLAAVRNGGSTYSRSMPLLDRAAVFLAFGYLLQAEETTSEVKRRTASPAPAPASALDPASALTPTASAAATGAQASISTAETTTSAPTAVSEASSSALSPAPTSLQTLLQQPRSIGPLDSVSMSIDGGDGTSSSGNGGDANSQPGGRSNFWPGGEPPVTCYEFSLSEERLLRGLTESASTAGLALGLQAFVTLILTVADFGTEDWPGVVSNGINATNKAILTALCFRAVASYDRALHTAGSNDVEHLLEGLGEKGLTGLFSSLAVLSWAIFIATLLGLVLPYIEENALARAVGDGLSHRTAEAVIEALEYLRALVRGI